MLFRRQPKTPDRSKRDEPVGVIPAAEEKDPSEPEIETFVLDDILYPKVDSVEKLPDPDDSASEWHEVIPDSALPLLDSDSFSSEEEDALLGDSGREMGELLSDSYVSDSAMDVSWESVAASGPAEGDIFSAKGEKDIVLQEGFFESMALQKLVNDPAPGATEVDEIITEIDNMEEYQMQDTDLTTMISRNTEIVGNISSRENVEIFGNIEGNIACDAIVKVYGSVHGKIVCDTLIANNATIVGDIECKDQIELRSDTAVQGSILCASAMISGDVQGDIIAENSIVLSNSASITGNISTKEFEVAKGATLNGMIEIKKDSSYTAPKPVIQESEPLSLGISSTSNRVEESLVDDSYLSESM